jgi:hypothetical protein
MKFELEGAGAHETDRMRIECFISGLVRFSPFTPHPIPVLPPIVENRGHDSTFDSAEKAAA